MSNTLTQFRWPVWAPLSPPCAAMLLMAPQTARADLIRDCEQLQDPPLAIRACSRLIVAIPANPVLHNKCGIAYLTLVIAWDRREIRDRRLA